jgi:hypothetical protein
MIPASQCPNCGKQAVSFRRHVLQLLDVDRFPCSHCGTSLRRNLVSWVGVLGTLAMVIGAALGLVHSTPRLHWEPALVFLFLAGWLVIATAIILFASYLNWRWVGLHRTGRPADKAAA